MSVLAYTLTIIGWIAWGVTGMRRHPAGLARLAYWIALLIILTNVTPKD